MQELVVVISDAHKILTVSLAKTLAKYPGEVTWAETVS